MTDISDPILASIFTAKPHPFDDEKAVERVMAKLPQMEER